MSGKDNEPCKHNFVDFSFKRNESKFWGDGALNEFHSMNEYSNKQVHK